MLSLLCRLLLVRMVDCTVNLSDFYSYRLIGKLTANRSTRKKDSAPRDQAFTVSHLSRTPSPPWCLCAMCGNNIVGHTHPHPKDEVYEIY